MINNNGAITDQDHYTDDTFFSAEIQEVLLVPCMVEWVGLEDLLSIYWIPGFLFELTIFSRFGTCSRFMMYFAGWYGWVSERSLSYQYWFREFSFLPSDNFWRIWHLLLTATSIQDAFIGLVMNIDSAEFLSVLNSNYQFWRIWRMVPRILPLSMWHFWRIFEIGKHLLVRWLMIPVQAIYTDDNTFRLTRTVCDSVQSGLRAMVSGSTRFAFSLYFSARSF